MFVIFQRLMTSFVNRLFTVSSFESDFPLVLDVDGEKGKNIVMPEGIRYENTVNTSLTKHLRTEVFRAFLWCSTSDFRSIQRKAISLCRHVA